MSLSDLSLRRVPRRNFLAGLSGVGLASGFAPMRLIAQQTGPVVTPLTDQLAVISGLGGNVLTCARNGRLVAVDSGAAGNEAGLLAAIDSVAESWQADTLFNTHWHPDQVGGNAAFSARGARIIAHAKTTAHLSIPYYLPDQDIYRQPPAPEARPTESFYSNGNLDFEGSTIRYAYLLEAHTDGDAFVHFERDNVIAAGDAISPVRDPIIDWYGGGWLGGRLDSLAELLAVSDSETRFVPSYGPVVDRSYVESEQQLMQGLFDILWDRVRAGDSADDIYRSGALAVLPRSFDDPARLLYDTHKSMWAHYNTLSPDIV